MKHAVRHQLSALQKIVDSPGSTQEEIAGARAEIHKLAPKAAQRPAAPAVAEGAEGAFELNPYFEETLANGPYFGALYLDYFGINNDTALSRYCVRRAAHFGYA